MGCRDHEYSDDIVVRTINGTTLKICVECGDERREVCA